MDIIAMIKLCINTLASAVLTPVQNTGYIVFIFVVYTQYKRTTKLQEYIYGKPRTSTGNLVTTSVLAGLVAGILVSIPMTLLGITFDGSMGFEYLLLISLFMMFIEPRFICFSYSGGLLSIVSLVSGLNFVDVTSVMMLVAVLHLIEAVLVYIDGYRGAVPVFLQRNDGTIVGGFSMQRFWPIPLALILFMGYGASQGGGVPTPDWWPLLLPTGLDLKRISEALFLIAPLSAVLGYTDFTSAYLPREKCKTTSLKLGLFSIVLFGLAYVSAHIFIFKYIAAIFAPAAHEALIERGKRLEKKKKSIFDPADAGVKILDTLPGGPADTMGIKPGDTVLSINNRAVNNSDEVTGFFSEYINYIWVEILCRNGNRKVLEYKDYKEGVDGLGVLAVPNNLQGLAVLREQKSFLGKLLEKFKTK